MGMDRRDEMWSGELHMTPSPYRHHQQFAWALEAYLDLRWARPSRSIVIRSPNLASPRAWPKDYRIPDLVLIKPERFGIDRSEYLEGAAGAEGWVPSREIGVEMRGGRPGKLEIRLQGNDATREELPED